MFICRYLSTWALGGPTEWGVGGTLTHLGAINVTIAYVSKLSFTWSGEGAFAVVEQCAYTPGGAKGGPSIMVAVKRLKPGVVSKEEDLTSFMAEVKYALVRLSSVLPAGLTCHFHWRVPKDGTHLPGVISCFLW